MGGLNYKEMQSKIKRLEEEVSILRAKMSEMNKLEEQLYGAQKMEALAKLAGGIVHDFNNILQTILDYTEFGLIGKTEEDPDYRTFIGIECAIKRGSDLTKQLLTFGRKIVSRFVPLDLSRKTREIRDLLRRTIPRMIDIELMPADRPAMVNADAGQIEQILMNLCINARDAMPDGGKLTIKTENIALRDDHLLIRSNARPGEYVLLTVSDTGCGISTEIMDNIFEPFFTTKEKGKGTGLGLPIVSAIVKDHDGFIDCSSRVGGGTTFRIYFPAFDFEPEQSNIIRPKGEGVTGGDETILLVDDELDILDVWKEMIQEYGYTVHTASNGEQAIYIYSHTTIDLVILDVGMPGMGGIKCLQKLLSMDQKAQVVISTGYFSDARIKEALELGAKDFLAKPYSVKELLKTVRKVLDQR